MSPKSKGRKRPPSRRPAQVSPARRAALEAARQRSTRRRWTVAAVFLVAVMVLGLAQVTGGGGGDDGSDVESQPTTTVTPEVRAAPVSIPTPPVGGEFTGGTPCPADDGSSRRTTTFDEPPPMCIDPDRSYRAEVATSKGTIAVALMPDRAPRTVNNFVVLSRYHFYDGIAFHRIATGTFVQGGDPEGDGSGGPGYRFDDELPEAGDYKVGTVAMANSGPDTNGSQFFFIVGEGGLFLNEVPNYSIFGEVVEGMDVLAAIEAAGTPETADDPDGGKPTEVVTIDSITIKES